MSKADVVVYGATGYTGRAIVDALLADGRTVIVAGRDAAALEKMAAHREGVVGVKLSARDDAEGLQRVTESAKISINCAVSYDAPGYPMAEAALATGTQHIDISNAQASVRTYFDDFGARFAAAGVALVPSAGFICTLTDAMAAVAARDLGEVDIEMANAIENWHPSGMNFDNFLTGIGRDITQYDRQRITLHRPRTRLFDFGTGLGTQRVVTFPGTEVFSVPRHVRARTVQTAITTSTWLPPSLGRFLPLVVRTSAFGLRHKATTGVTTRVSARLIGGGAVRSQADPTRYRTVLRAVGAGGQRTVTARGEGIYDITAPIIALVVAALADPNFTGSGALAASEFLNPEAFLKEMGAHGVDIEVVDK